MIVYGTYIVYSTDAFSEHYCRTRASLSSININGTMKQLETYNIDMIP